MYIYSVSDTFRSGFILSIEATSGVYLNLLSICIHDAFSYDVDVCIVKNFWLW